jgi:hypothetical protein
MNAYWVNPLAAEMLEELSGGEAFAFAGIYATFIPHGFIGRFLAHIRSTFNADFQRTWTDQRIYRITSSVI